MTFDEAVVAELAHSGVLERWPWVDALLKLGLSGGLLKLRKIWWAGSMTSAIAERAEENFPSKAYGPYLEARGFAPVLARGLAA